MNVNNSNLAYQLRVLVYLFLLRTFICIQVNTGLTSLNHRNISNTDTTQLTVTEAQYKCTRITPSEPGMCFLFANKTSHVPTQSNK